MHSSSTDLPQVFHSRDSRRFGRVRSLAFCVIAAAAILSAQSPIKAQITNAEELYRVFLTSGPALPSYGEHTRLGDRIVFVLPVGEQQSRVELQLMSLPVSAIDLRKTAGYAEGVRARSYGVTRGPSDYSALVADVNLALEEIDREADRQKRLALAEAVRSRLIAWPAAHFNYRLADLRKVLADIDELVDGFRRELGQPSAPLEPVKLAPEYEAPLPRPTLQQSLDLARAAAEVAPDPATRDAILRAVAAVSATASSAPAAPSRRADPLPTTSTVPLRAAPKPPAPAPAAPIVTAPPKTAPATTAPTSTTPTTTAPTTTVPTTTVPIPIAPLPAVASAPPRAVQSSPSESGGRFPLALLAGTVLVLGVAALLWYRRSSANVSEPEATAATAPVEPPSPPPAEQAPGVPSAAAAQGAPPGVPPAAPAQTLEITDVRETQRGGYHVIDGAVRNLSDRTLYAIEALIEWQTAGGDVLVRETALIEHLALAPAAVSGFSILTKSNPALASYSLRFQAEGAVLAERRPMQDQ